MLHFCVLCVSFIRTKARCNYLHVVGREHVVELVLHRWSEVLVRQVKQVGAHGLVQAQHELLDRHPDASGLLVE